LIVVATIFTPLAAAAESEPIELGIATKYVTDLGNEALAVLNTNAQSAEQRNEQFCRLMLKHVDFRHLGRRVLGPMYRKSSPQQREEFYRLFAAYFIDTVNGMIGGLKVSAFATGRARSYPNNEVIVETVIDKSDSQKIEAGWRLASNGGVLKIVDVYVMRASATGHFRDKISRSSSTSISGNISKLKQKLNGSQTLQVVQQHMS
jgi:ABC-type transporter MlaC component